MSEEKQAKKPLFRSKFEQKVSHKLSELGLTWKYESDVIKYIKPVSHYTPDFTIDTNKYIEVKGRFLGSDRTKHKLIKAQSPEVNILFVFQNPYLTLSKKSKTTYADWCEKNGFEWTTLEKLNGLLE